jgi:protein required for attachment to host cells
MYCDMDRPCAMDGGEEEGFVSGIVGMLNCQVLSNKFGDIVIIAAPKTRGEMRKHCHKSWKQPLA